MDQNLSGGRSRTRLRVFIVLGGGAFLAALALGAVGKAEMRPFLLAFLGGVTSEAIVSLSDGAFNWRTTVRFLAAITAWSLLTVAAVRVMGNFLGDAMSQAWLSRPGR